MKSKILGFDTSFPVYISATALGKLAHPDGEVALTRASYNEGIIQMCPTLASCTLEEMTAARQPGQIQFYQLYVNSDKKITEAIVKKAERLGCKALCITVDAPALGMYHLQLLCF
ncbi:alpha-hydroxy-acid oxidizing protein [Patescibacteria group bacterium]|nr:alpha-hydroxy-acid oxidizing protein [Patescibacteria group bacterium]